MVGENSRRLLVENSRELFLSAELKARRIIRTNGNFNVREDVKFIESLKEGLLISCKDNKELSKYIDYWNLVLYYLRKIVYENECL
tara:strand:+ start:1352 stop:1609 length:258 start_codon:yes stop_codon:yes gene_type:complete